MTDFDLASQLRALRDDDSPPPIDFGGPLTGIGGGSGGIGGILGGGGPGPSPLDDNPFSPKALRDLLREDQQARLHDALKQLAEPVSSRVVGGAITPPRTAIDQCLRLVRKLASLREEHRALTAAQQARADLLEDTQDERDFRALPIFEAQQQHRQALADNNVLTQPKIAALAEEIRTRIDHQIKELYSDGRIGVNARAEGDMARTQELANPQDPPRLAQEPPEISTLIMEADNGAISWSRDTRLVNGSSVADRVQALTVAMAMISQVKERISARIGLADVEIRKLYLELEALQAQLDSDSATIAEQGRKHELQQIDRNIYRLKSRDDSFMNNFASRIALTVTRYVDTAQDLTKASRRMADSLAFHKLASIDPFDPKTLIDTSDPSDDDKAIQSYLDTVEFVERAWNDRIACSVGGLLSGGAIVLKTDPGHPEKLTATLPWAAPLKNCYVEGLLVEGPQREMLQFGIQISSTIENLNNVGTVLSREISRKIHTFPVETWVSGSPDRESSIVRGGFLASLADKIEIVVTAEAAGRSSLNIRLYVEAFGLPDEPEVADVEPAPPPPHDHIGLGS